MVNQTVSGKDAGVSTILSWTENVCSQAVIGLRYEINGNYNHKHLRKASDSSSSSKTVIRGRDGTTELLKIPAQECWKRLWN